MWLTLEVAGCGGDIEPISDPIAPQSFGLSLAPARNNDVIVRYSFGEHFFPPPPFICERGVVVQVKNALRKIILVTPTRFQLF